MTGRWLAHGIGSLAIIGLVFTLSPRVFAGDTDTARNYLSTIVSCLSTIFALCISITLVAIQLTASRYTHRVLDLFIKLPFNISLTLFYFVTIIQSLFLLSRITEPIRETLPSYLQPQMNADMVMVVLCFLILIAYMHAVIRMLRPEQIVTAILHEFAVAMRRKEGEALQRVEQICDIAKRAAGDMDSTTGMIAVQALQKMAVDGTKVTRQSVIRQYIEIGAIAAKERESGMLGAVLYSVAMLGESALTQQRLDDADEVVRAFERIVRSGLIGQQLFHFIERAVSAIYELADKAMRTAGEAVEARSLVEAFAERAFESIRKIGEEVLAREVEGASYVARTLLARNFGRLIRSAVQLREMGEGELSETGWRLLCDYLSLARMLLVKAELRDIVPITTWLREELSVDSGDSGDAGAGSAADGLASAQGHGAYEVVPLYCAILLAALADYSDRKEAARLILHAVAARRPWPRGLRAALTMRQIALRPLFDYRKPLAYIDRAILDWDAYRDGRQSAVESSVESAIELRSGL